MADNHIGKLDFLRGIAILCVFLFHVQLSYFPNSHELSFDTNGMLNESIKDILISYIPSTFGWSGVQLFLLISGFLIHNNFLKNRSALHKKAFFSKRFWRIYPPYILTIIGLIILTPTLRSYSQSEAGQHDILYHVLMIHNLSESTIFGINPSFWSIALEVQLYLLYPLFLMLRKNLGIFPSFGITFCIALFLKLSESTFTQDIYYNTYFLSPGALWYNWCAGALLAEFHHTHKSLFKGHAGRVCLLAALVFLCSRLFVIHYYLMHILAVLFWAAFMEWYLLKRNDEFESKFFKIIASLGIYSYSFYLIHQPIITHSFNIYNNVIGEINPLIDLLSAFIKPILAFVVTILLSRVLYKYLELPSIKLGHRIRVIRSESSFIN